MMNYQQQQQGYQTPPQVNMTPQMMPQQAPMITESPAKVIGGEIKRKITGLFSIFKVKRVFPALLMMALMWVLSYIGQKLSLGDLPAAQKAVKVISYLTFAGGGVSTNKFYALGGTFGKSLVSATLIIMVGGGFSYIKRGFKIFGQALGSLGNGITFKHFMYGLSYGFILYNFFTGTCLLSQSMAGIAGFFSMIWAIGGGIHFLSRMAVACTADKYMKLRYVNFYKANAALAGLAVGFLLSIPLSLLPFRFTCYGTGLFCLVISCILSLTVKERRIVSSICILCILLAAFPSSVYAKGKSNTAKYSASDKILPDEFKDYDTIDYSGCEGNENFDVIVEGEAGTFRAQGSVTRKQYYAEPYSVCEPVVTVTIYDEDGYSDTAEVSFAVDIFDSYCVCLPEEMIDEYIEKNIKPHLEGTFDISNAVVGGKNAIKMVVDESKKYKYGEYYRELDVWYFIEIDDDIVAGVKCYMTAGYNMGYEAEYGIPEAQVSSYEQNYFNKWLPAGEAAIAKTINQPFSYEITTTIEPKGTLDTLFGGEEGSKGESGDVSGEVSGKESGEVSGKKSKDKISGEESGEISGEKTKDKISGEESGDISGDETKDKISGEESGNVSGEVSGDGDETLSSAQAKKNEATNGGATTAAATGAAGGILGGIGAAGALGGAVNPTPPMPGDGGMPPGQPGGSMQPGGNQGQPGNGQGEPQPNQNNTNNENRNALSEEERKRKEAEERQRREQQNANNGRQNGKQQGNLTDKQKQQLHQLEVAERLGAKDVEEAKKILKQIQKENLKTRSLAYAGSAAIGFVYGGTGIIKSGADLGATYVKTAGDLAKPGMGTAFKTSYTMLTEEFGGMAESYANNESIWKGLARGVTKGTTNVVQDMATSPKQIIYTRVVGETVKSIADNVGKGNSYWTITTEAAKAAGKGIVHAGVDIVVGTAGKIAKETTKTAAKTIDIACGMTSDIVKGIGNLYDYITGA